MRVKVETLDYTLFWLADLFFAWSLVVSFNKHNKTAPQSANQNTTKVQKESNPLDMQTGGLLAETVMDCKANQI